MVFRLRLQYFTLFLKYSVFMLEIVFRCSDVCNFQCWYV